MRPIRKLFNQLKKVPQDPRWHPEGNVCNHTARVVAAAYEFLKGGSVRGELEIAATFHDIGKLRTTVIHPDGHISAHGHERESLHMFDELVENGALRIRGDMETIRFLIANHMRFKMMHEMRRAKRTRMIEEAENVRGFQIRNGRDVRGLQLIKSFARLDTADGQAAFWPSVWVRKNGHADCTMRRPLTQDELNRDSLPKIVAWSGRLERQLMNN